MHLSLLQDHEEDTMNMCLLSCMWSCRETLPENIPCTKHCPSSITCVCSFKITSCTPQRRPQDEAHKMGSIPSCLLWCSLLLSGPFIRSTSPAELPHSHLHAYAFNLNNSCFPTTLVALFPSLTLLRGKSLDYKKPRNTSSQQHRMRRSMEIQVTASLVNWLHSLLQLTKARQLWSNYTPVCCARCAELLQIHGLLWNHS